MQNNTLKNTGGQEIQAIKDDLVNLKDDGLTLARNLKGNGESVAREGMDNLRAAGEREFRKIEKHVQDKPGQSILLAFAAGLVASYVLGSRR
jgi:ElaB/YqjD/DUF883 family membrane-anchored ribosome-binding protein